MEWAHHPEALGAALSFSFPPIGPSGFWWGEVLGPGSELPLSMRVLGVSGHELCCQGDPATTGIEPWVPYLLPPLRGQGGWAAPGVVWEFLNQ